MSDLTLDQLIAGLETPEEGLDKQASEAEAKAEPSVADELKSVLTKEAAVATAKSTEEPVEMNKEAQAKGVALADAIIGSLSKQANVILDQSEDLVDEQDDETERTPEGTVNEVLKAVMDRGFANGATDEETHQDGEEEEDEGDASEGYGEDVEDNSDIEKSAAVAHLVEVEGCSFEDAVTLVKEAEEAILAEETELMKVAAVNELMSEGYSMEDAVELVKEASAAKVGAAIDRGVRTVGVKLRRAAGPKVRKGAKTAAGKVSEYAGKAKGAAKEYGTVMSGSRGRAASANAAQRKNMATNSIMSNSSRERAGKGIAKSQDTAKKEGRKTNLYRAGTGAAVLATGGAAYGMNKKAAVDNLVEAGIDFDLAVQLVNVANGE